MTLSRAAPSGKPRRLGLYLPYGVVGLLVAIWSFGWLWLRHETEGRLEEAAAALRAHGWRASWSSLSCGGYPFRLDIDASNLQLADPSGWSIVLPSLKSEAYVFAPTHWLLATGDGATFTWPGAGPVRVTAPLLRASINSWDQRPPRISLVGDDLTFAGPFPLASATALQFYTRAGPNDQGALLLEVDGGVARAATDLDKLAGGRPASLTVDAILSHASALAGPDWRAAVQGWSLHRGSLSLQRLAFAAGATSLDAHAGALSVDDQGRLAGWASGQLSQVGAVAPARLVLQGGGVWLGPERIAASPRVY